MEQSIISLIQQATKGDSTAYKELFLQYEAMIYRTAYIYVNNEQDALDIVQETAYRSLLNIHRLKNPEYFKSWLIKITINCAIDFLRKRKHTTTSFLNEWDMKEYDPDVALSVSLLELVQKSLDEKEKSVVLLKYYYDYRLPVIAEILDLPLNTVKTILYRALKRLRVNVMEGSLYGE